MTEDTPTALAWGDHTTSTSGGTPMPAHEAPAAAIVVPLCRAARHGDAAGARCPHCARPTRDDRDAVVLPLPRLRGHEVLAGEL